MNLVQKIHERLDDDASELVETEHGPGRASDYAGREFAALRAVLDIHQSEQAHSYYGDTRLCCKACHRNGQTPQWPCKTVAAIATALHLPASD